MRGKACFFMMSIYLAGITPACAGKSSHFSIASSKPWDHPRMCGEKQAARWEQRDGRGSPPHVRGKASSAALKASYMRITPACAGKSKGDMFKVIQVRDHPRMCGEKDRQPIRASTISGSPPHVRGKVLYSEQIIRTMRITPACAGKSAPHHIHHVRERDHPCMCGEKSYTPPIISMRAGSPPHVRGKARLTETPS